MNTIVEHINSAGFSFVEFAVPMLVQSGILVVILLLADLLLRKKVKAVFRYWIWMLVLLKLVLPTSLSSPLSLGYLFGEKLTYQDLAETTSALELADPVPTDNPSGISPIYIQPNVYIPPTTPTPSIVEPATAGPVGTPAPVTPLSWQGVVFLVWLAVVIAMGLLLLQRALFVRGLVAQAKDAPRLMNDALEYCRAGMRVKRRVGLKISPNATTPSVCGLIRPVILVPWNLASTLGASRLRTVLMHELAHIRRADLWVNLAQTILQIMYFYNPLLWFANCMIRRIREQAVDEAVLVAMGGKAQQYPQTLVDVAKTAFKRPALSLRLIGVVESESALAGRIKHILGRPIPKSARLGIVSVLSILITAAVLLPMARAQRQAGPETSVEDASLNHFVGRYALAGHPDTAAFEITKEGDEFIFRDLAGPKFEMDIVLRGLDGRSFEMEKGRDSLKFGNDPRERYSLRYNAAEDHYILDSLGMRGEVQDSMISPLTDLIKISAEKPEGIYTATLANGVVVELMGVCELPDQGKQWWAADGSLLEDIFWEGSTANRESSVDARQIVFRIRSNESEPALTPTINFRLKRRLQPPGSWSGAFFVRKDNQTLEEFRGCSFSLHDDQKSIDISADIGYGQWKTLTKLAMNSELSLPKPVFTDIGYITWNEPTEESGKTTVSATLFDAVKVWRIDAVDKRGDIHVSNTALGQGFDGHQIVKATFSLPLSHIEKFRFQTRPFSEITFKNVSLRPGVQTAVQVEVEEPEPVFVEAIEAGKTEVSLPIRKIFSDKTDKGGSFEWETSIDPRVRFRHGWCFFEDGELKGYVGTGASQIPQEGRINLKLDVEVKENMLNLKVKRLEDLVDGSTTTTVDGKTSIPAGAYLKHVNSIDSAFLTDNHLTLWQGDFIRDGKVVKSVIYAAYLTTPDDPETGFKPPELQKTEFVTPKVGPDVGFGIESSVSPKLVMLLDAINSCAAETDLNMDSISISERNIEIKGDTSDRANTRKFLDTVKDNGLNVSSLRLLNAKDNRDKFNIIVQPEKDWQKSWQQRKTDVQLGVEETVSPKLIMLLVAIKSVAAETDLNIESISVSAKSMSIEGDTSRRTETLKFLDAIKDNGLDVSRLNLDERNNRDRFRMTVEPKQDWRQWWQQHKTAVLVEDMKGRIERRPKQVQAIDRMLREWFRACVAGDVESMKEAYPSPDHPMIEDHLHDMKELLGLNPGWRFSLLAVMWDEAEAMAVSGVLEHGDPQVSAPMVLVWTFKNSQGRWGIIDIDLEELKGLQIENSRFMQKHPNSQVWFDNPDLIAPKMRHKTAVPVEVGGPNKEISFGPSIEREIEIAGNDDETYSNRCLIDFETGILYSLPDSFKKLQNNTEGELFEEVVYAWCRQTGIDTAAIVEYGKPVFALKLGKPAGTFLDAGPYTWESISPEKLVDALEYEDLSEKINLDRTAATFAFRTIEGNTGLLDVLDITNKTVRIRYKMVKMEPTQKIDVPLRGYEIEKTDSLVWGKQVNGLRAALEFVPRKKGYSYGQIIGLRYHIQNVSAEPIQFVSETWRQDHEATVEDEQGNLQQVSCGWYSGWTPVERYYLKPGEKAVLERSAFGLAAEIPYKQAKALDHPVGCTLVCKPGIYYVSFSLIIPGVRSSSLPPQAEDWGGVLQTGKHKLVVTTASPEHMTDVPVEGEKGDESNESITTEPKAQEALKNHGNIAVISVGKSIMYSSIQEAIDAAPAGSVVRIGPGVYKERLEIDKPLTLEGAGWDQTTIVTENNTADTFEEAISTFRKRILEAKSEEHAKKLADEFRAQFEAEMKEKMAAQTHLVSDTEDVVIRNLKLTSPGRNIDGRALSVPIIKFSNAGAMVSGCAVVGTPGNGINIEEGSDVQIRDSLVAGVWSTGIAVTAGKGDVPKVKIINCDVRNCNHRGITIGPGCDSTVVEGCRISGSSWHGIRYDSASPRIIGNLIFANVRFGIYASGDTAADIRQNLFYGNEMSGISCWFKNQDTIEANTFVGNKRSGLEVLGASRPIVRKNIFYSNPTGVFCANISGDSASAASDDTINIEENLFWGFEHKAAWSHPGVGDEIVTEEVGLDEKAQNVVFDPECKDITKEDFSLKQDSAARRLGIGAADLIDSKSPWPIQDEEIPVIPEEDTEDTSWMGRISSTGEIQRPVVVPVEIQGADKPLESVTGKPSPKEGSEHPGRISGVVVNSVTGEPIAGAYVGVGDFGDSGGSNYSRHREQGFHDKTKTDAEGRFELNGLVFTDKHRELEYHPLVVTHPDFVRHDEKIELLSGGPARDVKISLRLAAKIDVTIVDADGNPLQGQWLLRLEALDGRRFIPPGSDPHLSSFASNVWAHWPDLRSNMGFSNGFTFTELDSGRYLIEAIRVHLVDKPTPGNIWKPTITYHGSIPGLEIEAGQSKQVRLTPQDNQTRLTITPPDFPDKLMDKLELSSQMPVMCLISRSPGALLWDDGKIRHLEDQRFGRIDKKRFFRGFFTQGQPLTINNLPPGSYSLFTMAVYGQVAGYLIGARADLAKGDNITLDIPWRQPTGPSMFGPNRSFDYPVDLEARDYSLSELCEILTGITRSNPRIIADTSIENEKLKFGRGGMSVWDVLEKLYLDKGWRVDEGQDKTLIIKPAEQTNTPVVGELEKDTSAKERIELFGLDLTDAPRTTESADLSDLFEARPPGSKSYHRREDIDIVYSRLDGKVYYVPDKDIFYIQHDKLGSSTLTYYGPFNGDPHKVLGQKKDVLVDVKGAEAVSAESEVAAGEDGPRITFESLVCDLGQIPPNTKHVCEFKFTNTGNEVLKITRTSVGCSCTVPKLTEKEYVPGESGTLEVTYQSSARAGRVIKAVFVYNNTSVNPVKLTIKAEIVVKVDHKPERLSLLFKGENAGCPPITLTSLDNQPFSITGFKSTGDSITAEFDPSVKEASLVLKPKVDMEKLRKGLKGQVEISLTHPECKKVTIYFDTLAEFQAEPRVVYVREAEPLKPVTKTVRIRSNYNEDVEIESTSSKKGTVKVLAQEKVLNGYQFELQITPPLQESKRRVFTDVFTVELKGGQKLQITCYGIYTRKPAKTAVESAPKTDALIEGEETGAGSVI